jgi:branched-chain amino acid transport system permease protein
MSYLKHARKSLLVALWFMFLTFPIVVIRVNTVEHTIAWRWLNVVYGGVVSFTLFFAYSSFQARRREERERSITVVKNAVTAWFENMAGNRAMRIAGAALLALFIIFFPFIFSPYQTNIMTTAFMYVVLGLGLNIVVGLAGLLNLGYAAFYAVGAYTYALLNYHYGLGFWAALPVGALFAALFGVLLGLPVLRLRGDYLAIVTLGFGEIVRLLLENWNDFSFGPSGISNIPRPSFFGMNLDLGGVTVYIYFLVVALCLITVFIVERLRNSRIGRALAALREDEIACEAMGIDKAKIKLIAFAFSAMWAGLVGVIFAAKTTFINPASFTFLESAMILSIVVLGGLGSTPGIILAAVLLILLPEYLRAFSDYRMLLFGITMVVMMIFRPQGMVSSQRRAYHYTEGNDHEQTRPE